MEFWRFFDDVAKKYWHWRVDLLLIMAATYHFLDSTALSNILAVAGFIIAYNLYEKNVKFQRSERSLEYAKGYFERAIVILEKVDNSNTKWHQIINAIQVSDRLLDKITDPLHKFLYIQEIIHAGFSICQRLDQIDNLNFFYGVSNYENRSSDDLHPECAPPNNCYRVNPNELKSLVSFLDKWNRVAYDDKFNESKAESIFREGYFTRPINCPETYKERVEPFIPSAIVVTKYIEEYARQEKKHSDQRQKELSNLKLE